eukprot:NODE_795_length_1446_cov_19.914817_g657_i0.p2 GENE.NODE_795_length_1446_cov_19.914817_g657_i0~~NODE_795_length_1446_cov_19.914817_g657_i0.p2  ORF type:complete len:144 (+),score=15.59 NODE_795_length_1446_cov_19.914817_g657_i0:969-1400(+)
MLCGNKRVKQTGLLSGPVYTQNFLPLPPAFPRFQVYVIFDANFQVHPKKILDSSTQPQPASKSPVQCYSVPGINFAYSAVDKREFVKNGIIVAHKALARMKDIMGNVFLCMQADSVRVPVLNAIGCGAFKGSHSGASRFAWTN